MRCFFFIIVFLLSLFVFQNSYSQNSAIDSLQKVLQTQKEDTSKVNTLNTLSRIYEFGKNYDIENALKYGKDALSLSEKINFKRGKGDAYVSIGRAYQASNNNLEALKNYFVASKVFKETGAKRRSAETDVDIGSIYSFQLDNNFEALKFYNSALRIYEGIGEEKGVISNLYICIGSAYFIPGNYSDALKNYYSALRLAEEARDKHLIALSYGSIGDCYSSQGDYPEALKNTQAALKFFQEDGDNISIAHSYNSIAYIYVETGRYSEALQKYLEGKKIFEQPGMPDWGIPGSQLDIGALYVNMGEQAAQAGDKITSKEKFSEALEEYLSALKFYEKIEHKGSIAATDYYLGEVSLKLSNFSDAKDYLYKGLQLSKMIGDKEIIKRCFSSLSVLDSIKGNYKGAYENYKMYVLYRDSLVNEEAKKKSLQAQMQYNFDKKESAAKAEQDKKDVLTNAEISRQKVVRNFSVTGAFAVLSLGGYVFYNFRKRKKLESQQALSNERLRISRELHDDIGSTLGSIAVYSDVAKNRSVKNESPTEVLSKIGTASRELIEKMSDIVWSLNPDNETFEQLQNRMQGFVNMILTPRNISVDFKSDDELKTLQLTSEQRKNIFLIYKEAVHNIIKYAECKNVLIALTKSNNSLSLVIKDDGKGFDSLSFGEGRGEAYNGNGFKNMKARADDIHAGLTIDSKIGEGTSIEMKLPLI